MLEKSLTLHFYPCDEPICGGVRTGYHKAALHNLRTTTLATGHSPAGGRALSIGHRLGQRPLPFLLPIHSSRGCIWQNYKKTIKNPP